MRAVMLLCGLYVASVPGAAVAQDSAATPRSETEAPAAESADDSAGPAPFSASGAPSSDGKAQGKAVAHYQRGREQYLAGRYTEALTELRLALDLDPSSPNLVYNVARVNEDLGNLDDAIMYYQRYLRLLPETEHGEREKTEKTLRRLEGAKQELAERRILQPPEPAREPEHALGRADLLFWVTAGAGGALAVGAGVCGLMALQRENDVGDFVGGKDGTLAERHKLISQADTLALGADLLFIGSAAALTGAALLFLLRDPEDEESADQAPQARFSFDAHGFQLQASQRF